MNIKLAIDNTVAAIYNKKLFGSEETIGSVLQMTVDELEKEQVIGSDLPLWRRALVLHFLSGKISGRLQTKIMPPVFRMILMGFGESEEATVAIIDVMTRGMELGTDQGYKLLSRWARGEISSREMLKEYQELITVRTSSNIEELFAGMK